MKTCTFINLFSSKQTYAWSIDKTDSLNGWMSDVAAWIVSFSDGTIIKANWVETGVSQASYDIKNEENYVRAVCTHD